MKCKIWQNLYTFKKFIGIQQKLTQNKWCTGKIINIFNNMFPKNSFKIWKYEFYFYLFKFFRYLEIFYSILRNGN
jgi:hypothetical protein